MKTGPIGTIRNPPEAAFSALDAAFQEAAGREELRVLHCEVGGTPVRFRVAGTALSEVILEPMLHLSCDPPPDGSGLGLEVDVWDGTAAGVLCAGCVVHPELTAARPQLDVSSDGRFVSYRRTDNLIVLDRGPGRMIGWFADGANPAFAERGRPFGSPLVLWCHDHGVQVVHAALVARRGAGVLIGGSGGSGKTTCALSCLAAGFSYLGDDYVGLRAGADNGFTGYSLYASAHAEPRHLARFTGFPAHAVADATRREDKHMIPLARMPGAALARSTAVRVVILPRVADSRDTSYRGASKGEALLGLAPSSLFAVPHVRKERVDLLADLVETTPCYRLELGRDLSQIPDRILDILGEVGAS